MFECLLVYLVVGFFVSLQHYFLKGSLKSFTYLEDGGFDESELGILESIATKFLFLRPASLQLFFCWFFDAIDISLISSVFIFCVSVSCSIGEVAFTADAGIVSAL
jgi:hypothetical protein